MALRRRFDQPVGLGAPLVPYDRSGGQEGIMPGMEVPQPGGTMRKMSFEFTDPAQAAAATPQAPPGAGIPPAGAQAPPPAAGEMPPQGDPNQQMAPPPDQQQQMPMIAGMSQPQQDTSLLSDEQLMQMAQSPDGMMGQQLADTSMDMTNPQAAQAQEQLMLAARRRLGY